jgi:hypothetical protein
VCSPRGQEWEHSGDPWYRSPVNTDLSDAYDASFLTILASCVGAGPVAAFPDQCSPSPGIFGAVTLYLGLDEGALAPSSSSSPPPGPLPPPPPSRMSCQSCQSCCAHVGVSLLQRPALASVLLPSMHM